ncbi:hypothetical protein, partial [Pseudomonas nitroreducens]|uniref:hypothetical protein n=1 Tax=Pseudomonas nitroreducens TaxID=46680 RepID=UPI001FB5B4BD
LFFENFFSTQSLGLPRSQTPHQREAHSTAIKLAVKHLGNLLFSSLPEQLTKSGKRITCLITTPNLKSL